VLGLLVTYACTCGALGAFVGALAAERLWWLMPGACPRCGQRRPLPRPWRPVLRYLAPGSLAGDTWRLLTTGRLTTPEPRRPVAP
jgi:hypothetical protein